MFNYYKIIVAGGRDFTDYKLVDDKLTTIRTAVWKNDVADDLEIVCGKARGADTLGDDWGKANHVGVKYFPAEWDKYGKSAGHRRNRQMGDYADALLAFWDGESRGTKGMIDYATEKGLSIFIVNY